MDTPELLAITHDWPPLYTLKKSPRARHVKLKASVTHGLQLVVPMRFNQKHIPRILEENRLWIQKQLANIASQLGAMDLTTLPEIISLSGIQQTWKIIYASNTNKKIRIMERPERELVLVGNINDKNLCKKMLVQWLKEQAQIHLVARLQDISLRCGLPYNNVTIRNQRSRWGSCSTHKDISLNFKLLFFPPEIMDHILIHELCHTKHLNHSAKFWRLVGTHDENWKQHTRTSRKAEKFIPDWLVSFDLKS